MRGLLTIASLSVLVASHAAAGGLHHDRLELPPAAPAFASSDGDRYGKFGPTEIRPATDLERFAQRFNAGNGRADLFSYPLDTDETGKATGNSALAGTIDHGAAQLQLRWRFGGSNH